jgi:integrase
MFSYDGIVLSSSLLNGFLRYLLPGVERLTYHDFRHLGANALLHAGAPGWMIRLTLNHASHTLWEYYAMQSERQEAAFTEGHRRLRLERFADARVSKEHAR